MKSKCICILGGTGVVGSAAYSVLSKLGYNFKICARNKEKLRKMYLYPQNNIQLYEIDMNGDFNVEMFFQEIDLVIGAIGPSTRYSEKMMKAAIKVGVPYIDPGGIHLKAKYYKTHLKTTVVVGAGLFPGLSGWILRSEISKNPQMDLFEIVIGGEYNFSKASAIDYIEKKKSCRAGIPMAFIRNGRVAPAEKKSPLNLPNNISGLKFLPYVTEEVQEIGSQICKINIESYTAASTEMFSIMKSSNLRDENLVEYLQKKKYKKQRGIIWLTESNQEEIKSIYFEGENPGKLTGEILAISANAILNMNNSREGIFTMAELLYDYPLIDELSKFENFKYERQNI